MEPTIIEDKIFEFGPLEVDDSVWMSEETPWRGFADELQELSVENRLSESVGQTNRILLNMIADYNPGTLARSIKRYFELNANAREVLVFKGKKQLSVMRNSLEDTNFFRTFIRRYTK